MLRIFSLVLWVHHSVQQIDWCEYRCGSESNVMCNANTNVEVKRDQFLCEGMVDAATPETVERLLGLHNYVRNYIAAGHLPGWPAAANMRQLTWDATSAEVARMWAFQCPDSRDRCRRTPEFWDVGQNVGNALDEESQPDGVLEVFKHWLDEILVAPTNIVENYQNNPEYERFAATVWARTHKVGCGLVNMNFTGSSGIKYYRQSLVCNYADAGLKHGGDMWITGEPCSKCPSGTRCNRLSTYPNLCSSPDDPPYALPVEIAIPSCASGRFNFVSFVLFAFSAIFGTSMIYP